MIFVQKHWLQAVPWENVLALNQSLCQAQKLEHTTQPKGFEAARRLWEGGAARSLSLKEVLDICRECHGLSPFTFHNGNTFAGAGRLLIEEWTKSLPPVESQIVQTTVSHYIAGLIGRRELLQVLKHFEGSGKVQPAAASAPTAAPVPPVREEAPVFRPNTSPLLSESQPRA